MEESDSDSSVERMFNKYSKKFKEDFTSKSIEKELERSPSINTNINMPSTSGALSVPVQLEHRDKKNKAVKRVTKKAKKATKRKKSIDTSVENCLNKSDPDYVPTRNYVKMTSKELNNIAARVRVYHETGVVLSDDDDIVPCQNKKKKEKRTEPLQRLEKVVGDRFGKGEVGKGWSYGVRRCGCCNSTSSRCFSKLPTMDAISANASKSLSGNEYSSIMQRLSTNAVNRFKKREERLLQIQQRQLLQHPEIADLLELDDSDVEPTPPPAVLSNDKREWIQRFMDSMTPDRIDYEKPQQKLIVQGINHTPPDTQPNAFLQQVLDKHADSLDAKTIVQRIDFKKEQERRSRLIQSTLDEHFQPVMAPASTPNFNSTELDQTAHITQSQRAADVCELSPIKKEQLPRVGPFDISGIAALEAEASMPVNAVATNTDLNVEPSLILTAQVETISENRNNEENQQQMIGEEDSCIDFSHIDRSNITIRRHKSVQDPRPDGLESNVKITTTGTDPRRNGTEDIMDFVNDLLAEEEESIHKEVEERCERLLENTRKTRDVLINAVNEYVVIDDMYEIEHDNSVQIIEDPGPLQFADSDEVVTVGSDTSSDVLVVDGPSTSRTRRTCRNRNKKETTTKKRKKATKASKAPVPASFSSSNSVLPADIIPKLESEEKETEFDQQPSRALRDCPICLEPFSNREISSTICGHVFCTPCIVAVIKSQKSCPNCRKGLTLKKIHPLFI